MAVTLEPPAADRSGAAYLVWEDLTVVLPSIFRGGPHARRLVNGLSGYAVPGRMLAVMGPSGSGKSTLLDSLAGRLASNAVVTGKIHLNGAMIRRLDYGAVAYVTQENTLLGTLTVRETISYSAQLRLPATMTKGEVRAAADGVMERMCLQGCADTPVGNWHLRGISGGEKKRLSIALEVLTRPRLLFLDEPTTGLDSAGSFSVALALRQMADEGETVVASVHQPSGDVFSLFDDLCLLSGGETVYFGDAQVACEFFQQAGFRCPTTRSLSDHFLRCVNTDFDQVNEALRGSRRQRRQAGRAPPCSVDEEATFSIDPILMENMKTSQIRTRLIQQYKRSTYAAMVMKRIHDFSREQVGSVLERSSSSSSTLKKKVVVGGGVSWWQQLATLTRRSSVNMTRDIGYYWLRLATYVVVSVCVGTVFRDVGTSYEAIRARTSSCSFVFGFMTFMSVGMFPSFSEEVKVFARERENGHYGVAAYVLSNLLSSSPYLLAVSLCSSAVAYPLVGLHPGFSRFAFFAANLYGCLAVVESVMMIVAAIVPNYLMGIVAGTGIIGVTMLSAGFVRLLPDLPRPIWRFPISYISYGAWALQGQYKNDMLGLEFDNFAPGLPKLSGDYVIQTIYKVSLDHSKWLDLTAIFALLVCYRLIFFFLVKLRERATPFFRLFYACNLGDSSTLSGPPTPRKKIPVPSLSWASLLLHRGITTPEGTIPVTFEDPENARIC